MVGLATGAFADFTSWYTSLLSYIRMPDCPELSVVVRGLMRQDPVHKDKSNDQTNAQILAVMKTVGKWKRDIRASDDDNNSPINNTMQKLIQDFNLPALPSDPYFGNNATTSLELLTPLRNLQTRLQAYLAMVDTTPRRQEPSPGVSTTTMHDVTAQISVDLGGANGVPRHLRTAGMANTERSIFDQRVIDHHQLFQNTSTSSSTRAAPVPLTQLLDPALSEDENEDVPDLNDNSDSDDDGGPTRAFRTKAALGAPCVIYMNANNMDVLHDNATQATPRRKRPKYTPGSTYRYSSPPTRPTHVHMVSMPEKRNDGYTTSSQAHIVETKSATKSQSQSTTPEEAASRSPSNDESRG
jgi:hypothetical protein